MSRIGHWHLQIFFKRVDVDRISVMDNSTIVSYAGFSSKVKEPFLKYDKPRFFVQVVNGIQ